VQLGTELQRRVEELIESRARIVTTQDTERRRLERDLHDGAQQSLVALRIGLAEAATAVQQEGAAAAAARLLSLDEEAARAARLLKDLARGIYPQALVDRGLRDALEGQQVTGALQLTVDAPGLGRFDPKVEAAVYFCCLEALQNVQKHTGAPAASLRLQSDAGNLFFEISDSGRGFDPYVTWQGSGIVNMRDRIGALGGELEVHSGPGRGTTVRGRIPVPAGRQL
jgi:signal transduction histidine kinase